MTLTSKETRILNLSSLSSDYAIVSMPRTAWYWLDDLVKQDFPTGGYKALVRAFGKNAMTPERLDQNLRITAQEHCERRMAELYNLANDNIPPYGHKDLRPAPAWPESPDLSKRMPSILRLFHFMPHATYLTTIWQRRNYSRLKGA